MRWSVAPSPDSQTIAALCQASDSVSPFLGTLLAQRGIVDVVAADRFLHPMFQHFSDPSQQECVRAAAKRVVKAMEREERIAIFGDYDVDGMTSVAVLVTALRELGVDVLWRVPHRLQGGYGLNMERARELVDLKAQLVITVDCGTASVQEVDFLNQAGLDVIVTDHHQVHNELPKAVALVNPQMWGEENEFRDMAGVGVAFLLVCGIVSELRRSTRFAGRTLNRQSFLDLVALGTVADMVPLRGHNRLLVTKGLKALAEESTRPGVVALKESAGCAERVMDAGAVAWYLAPRLNAAGRMGDASVGVELLLVKERPKALALMGALERLNTERRAKEQEIFEEAQAQVGQMDPEGPVEPLVLCSPYWHLGVVGIVASRVCERYRRPAVLLVQDGQIATGSARSVPGFDMGAALALRGDLFERFGGHSQAAGLTLKVERIPELRQHLAAVYATGRAAVASESELSIDCLVPLRELGPEHVNALERLAPFGTGNPEPTLASLGVRVAERKVIRNDSLKLMLESEGRFVEAVWWRAPELALRVGDKLDVAYVPEMRTFQGTTSLSLRIKDVRPSI